MVILYNCGNIGYCIKVMVVIGVVVYYFGNKIDMVEVLKEVFVDVFVMGNFDLVSLFKVVILEVMKKVIFDLLEVIWFYFNFVFFSGCDILFYMLFENIDVFFVVLNEFNNV